jgi:MraZ protein
MPRFVGEFESTLDAKQRFLLPAAFKKMLPQEGATSFVINRGKEQCLTLFTKEVWDSLLTTKFETLDYDDDANVREYQRIFLNGAVEVELDSAGRLLLPKRLMDHAKIADRAIVLSGALDRIEIWDAEVHNQFVAGITQERYSELGKLVKQSKKDETKS